MESIRDYPQVIIGFENGEELDITEYIIEIAIEFNDLLIDSVEMKVANPELIHSKLKTFKHGRKVFVYVNSDDGTREFLGGYEIYRISDERGTSDVGPFFAIEAFTKDYLMKFVEPKDEGDQTDNKSKNNVKVWQDIQDWGDVVKQVLSKSAYKFKLDIDPAKNSIISKRPHAVQSASMNDFAFVASIANFNMYLFWVDCDEDGNWTAHFKNPATTEVQYEEVTFVYDRPDAYVHKFEGKSVFDGVSEIKVQYIDPQTSLLTTVTVNGLDDPTREENQNQLALGEIGAQLNKDPNYIYEVALDIGNFSHRIYLDKIFTSQQEAKFWAESFYRQHNEMLVQTIIETPLMKKLRARQVHKFENFYDIWDGNHYFHQVRHVFGSDGAYTECSTRKVPTKDQSLIVTASTEESL